MPPRAHTRRQLLLGGAALALVACGGAASADATDEGKRGEGKRGEGKRGEGKRGEGKRGEGKRGEGKRGEGGAELALGVTTATLTPAELRRYYRTSGSLRALRSADLVATQAGIVLALNAEEGDTVKEGQSLARLDSRTFQLQAARDSVNVRNLEVELERLESLASYNAVSREELEKQRQAVASARANAKVTRHQVTMTEVIAPFPGTITRRHVDIGAMANAASPLYSLADLSQLDIDLHIPEAEAIHLEVGAPVELELLDGTRFEASVIRRAPVVDVLTGTVKFVARALTFPRGAVPGAFCRARVLVAQRAAPHTLPTAAIFDHEGLAHAYVIESGVARRRPVDVGLIGDERVELRGGVEPDELVIADAGAGISEGMPVRALEAAPPLPPLPPRPSSKKTGAGEGG
jgi:membrane fusion protein (multidrug efflux system)